METNSVEHERYIFIPCMMGLAAAGVVALYQEPKLRQFLLDQMNFFIPVKWSWKAVIPDCFSRVLNKVSFVAEKKGLSLPKNVLIGKKEFFKISNQEGLEFRQVAPNGDCFFLAYAVCLLTSLYKEQTIDTIAPVLNGVGLPVYGKAFFKMIASEAANAWGEKELEKIFSDNQKMNCLVSILREITVLAIQERPLTSEEDFLIPDQITILGLMPEEDFKQNRLERHEESIERLVQSVRGKLWANDALIFLLCQRMNFGIRIFQSKEFPLCSQKIELGEPCGNLILCNKQYTVIYPRDPSTSIGDQQKLVGKKERVLLDNQRVEIRRAEYQDHSFFISYAVQLLTAFYKSKECNLLFNQLKNEQISNKDLQNRAFEVALEATEANTGIELEQILFDSKKIGVFLSYLRHVMALALKEPSEIGTTQVPNFRHIKALCFELNYGVRVIQYVPDKGLVETIIGKPDCSLLLDKGSYASIHFVDAIVEDAARIQEEGYTGLMTPSVPTPNC